MHAQILYDAIATRYPFDQGWILMREVTPPGTKRRFDALAMTGWASRGLTTVGMEVKVSRGDWLRELKEPAKADPLVSLVHEWWIVAAPDIVEAEELPPGWGLLVPRADGVLQPAVKAAKRTPPPWTPEQWQCMMLRLATRRRAETPDELDRAKQEGYNFGVQEERKRLSETLERQQRSMDDLRREVFRAEAATGRKITQWADYQRLREVMDGLDDAADGGKGDRTLDLRLATNDLKHREHKLRLAALRVRQSIRALESVGQKPAQEKT